MKLIITSSIKKNPILISIMMKKKKMVLNSAENENLLRHVIN